jgi:hypothetical protein
MTWGGCTLRTTSRSKQRECAPYARSPCATQSSARDRSACWEDAVRASAPLLPAAPAGAVESCLYCAGHTRLAQDERRRMFGGYSSLEKGLALRHSKLKHGEQRAEQRAEAAVEPAVTEREVPVAAGEEAAVVDTVPSSSCDGGPPIAVIAGPMESVCHAKPPGAARVAPTADDPSLAPLRLAAALAPCRTRSTRQQKNTTGASTAGAEAASDSNVSSQVAAAAGVRGRHACSVPGLRPCLKQRRRFDSRESSPADPASAAATEAPLASFKTGGGKRRCVVWAPGSELTEERFVETTYGLAADANERERRAYFAVRKPAAPLHTTPARYDILLSFSLSLLRPAGAASGEIAPCGGGAQAGEGEQGCQQDRGEGETGRDGACGGARGGERRRAGCCVQPISS